MEGRVPEEIMEKVGSRVDELDVQLVDKREEDYVAPAYVAFSGKVGRVVNISFKLMQIAFFVACSHLIWESCRILFPHLPWCLTHPTHEFCIY